MPICLGATIKQDQNSGRNTSISRGLGGAMIDWAERKRYWRDTKWQMVATLAPFLLAVLALPLYAEALNSKRILGMPLGYFVVCHGLLVIAAIVVASFVNRQDAIDHWHGANEDP